MPPAPQGGRHTAPGGRGRPRKSPRSPTTRGKVEARRPVRRPARRQRRRRAVRAAGRRQRRDRRRGGDGRAGRDRRALVPGAGGTHRPRRARGGVLRQSQRGAGAGRHHRHQREDDHVVRARLDLRGGGHQVRPDRDHRLPDRRSRARRAADDPRSARAAADAARHAEGRLRRLRDGGLVARARAAPRGPPALRRRHLHQPDPRSPRLPRRHGVVLLGQAAALRDSAGGRGRRDQRRRSARRGSGRGRPPPGHLRDRRGRRRPAGPADLLARRPLVRGAHAAGHVPRALAARRAPERLQHPRRRRPPPWRWTCRSPPSRPA